MRSLALAVSVAAVVAVPVALYGAEPEAKGSDYATKKVCVVENETGTRLGRRRICRTQAEHDERRAENRRTIERVQAQKVTFGK